MGWYATDFTKGGAQYSTKRDAMKNFIHPMVPLRAFYIFCVVLLYPSGLIDNHPPADSSAAHVQSSLFDSVIVLILLVLLLRQTEWRL